MDEKKVTSKFILSIKGILAFYSLLLFNIGLLSAKKITAVWQNFAEIFSHNSNFVITSILMSTVALIWLLQGAPFKFVLWLGMVAIVLNFIVELFVTVLNTPDVIDAVYGIGGVIVTTLMMYFLKTSGLKEVVK